MLIAAALVFSFYNTMTLTKTGSRFLRDIGRRSAFEVTGPLVGLGMGVGVGSGEMSAGGAAGYFGAGALGGHAVEQYLKRRKFIANPAAAVDARKALIKNYPQRYGRISRLKSLPRALGRGMIGKGIPFMGALAGWGAAGLVGEKLMDKILPIWKRKGIEKQ